MSLFNNLFGGSNSASSELPKFWRKLESSEDLQSAIEKSSEKIIVIFKHSTRCIISKTVLRNFEKEIEQNQNNDIEFYYLDLLNYRNISNEIAENLHVTHQSPQVIVIKNQQAIYNASHDGISLESILKNIL